MELIFISILSILYLIILNYILIKYNFCLDKASSSEKHKLFLTDKENTIPISGSLFFIPFICYFLRDQSIYFLIISFGVFVIGFLSDIKVFKSPKLRLVIQISLIFSFVYLFSDLEINTRIEYLDNFNSDEVYRIFLVTLCFLVLINGSNFIDGVNVLCSLNFVIILIISYLLLKNIGYEKDFVYIFYLIIPLIVFCFFNFYNKNFLGDGAVYGLSFLIGYFLINLSLIDDKISPYFVANLLFYPAFENLFTIVRRILFKQKNYLPDNSHLHHLIFNYIKEKKIVKKKFLISSFVGILINAYLLIIYLIGMTNYSDTKFQIFLLFFNISVYIFVYRKLIK